MDIARLAPQYRKQGVALSENKVNTRMSASTSAALGSAELRMKDSSLVHWLLQYLQNIEIKMSDRDVVFYL